MSCCERDIRSSEVGFRKRRLNALIKVLFHLSSGTGFTAILESLVAVASHGFDHTQ